MFPQPKTIAIIEHFYLFFSASKVVSWWDDPDHTGSVRDLKKLRKLVHKAPPMGSTGKEQFPKHYL